MKVEVIYWGLFVLLSQISCLYSNIANDLAGDIINRESGSIEETIKESLEKGDLKSVEKLLADYNPDSDEEKAAKLYYQSRIAVEQDKMKPLLDELTTRYPKTVYGQKGLIELAKLSILERDYYKCQNYLSKNNQEIPEKELLLASTYLKTDQYEKAIFIAEKLIKNSKDEKEIERAYLISAEAYILGNRYAEALTTLEKMTDKDLIVENGALVDFKAGYCLEMLEDMEAAAVKYKSVITRFPNTECSFKAEQRLYELIASNKISRLELSYITPVPSINNLNALEDEDDYLSATSVGKDAYYLQVNAFSSRSNAESHSNDIRNKGFRNIIIQKAVSGQLFYVVAVGPFNTRQEALNSKSKLKESVRLESFIIQY